MNLDKDYKDIIEESFKRLHLKEHKFSFNLTFDSNGDATISQKDSLELTMSKITVGDIVRLAPKNKEINLGVVLAKSEAEVLILTLNGNSCANFDLKLALYQTEEIFKPHEIVLEHESREIQQLTKLFQNHKDNLINQFETILKG